MGQWLYSIDPASSKKHHWSRWLNGYLDGVGEGVPDIPHAIPVVVEDQFAGRNGGAILQLAKAAGHLVGAMGRRLDQVSWSQPAEWKRGLCRCRADKPSGPGWSIDDYEVTRAVREQLGPNERRIFDGALGACKSKTRATDIVDAVGIGLHHLGRVRGAQ